MTPGVLLVAASPATAAHEVELEDPARSASGPLDAPGLCSVRCFRRHAAAVPPGLRLAPLDLDYARIYEVDLGKLREAPPSGLPLRYLLLEETGRWDDGATSSARAADERGILLVGSSPSSPDRQAEFDAWFDDVHVDDILRVPGMLSARRYRRVAGAASLTGIDEDHVVIYEVAAPDLGSVLGGMAATRADRSISDVLQLDPLPRSFLGEELGGE